MASTESSSSHQKAIKEVLRRPPSHWVGDGFKVFPVFADKAFTKELSPFLMFDYAAPKEFPPSSSSSSSSSRRGGGHRRGVGQHPHRGFETVTIAFQGEVQHRDSTGNTGIIGPGDCQWMTAARGIIHEEFHSEEFTQRGGVFEMCQLWVNLPKQYKMSPAKYQGILDGDIPRVPLLDEKERDDLQEGVCKEEKSEQGHANDGYVRVIAGSFRGEKGPAETFTPINMWDIILPNGQDKVFELEVEKGHTTLLFVRRGEVKIQNKTLGLADVAIMTREGTKITVESLAKDTSLLVLSGEPIDEPIAARGPFVMNTHQELMEAMQDYNMGRNGFHHF